MRVKRSDYSTAETALWPSVAGVIEIDNARHSHHGATAHSDRTAHMRQYGSAVQACVRVGMRAECIVCKLAVRVRACKCISSSIRRSSNSCSVTHYYYHSARNVCVCVHWLAAARSKPCRNRRRAAATATTSAQQRVHCVRHTVNGWSDYGLAVSVNRVAICASVLNGSALLRNITRHTNIYVI